MGVWAKMITRYTFGDSKLDPGLDNRGRSKKEKASPRRVFTRDSDPPPISAKPTLEEIEGFGARRKTTTNQQLIESDRKGQEAGDMALLSERVVLEFGGYFNDT